MRDCSGIAWQARCGVGDRFGDVADYPSFALACLELGCPEQWGGHRCLAPMGTNMSFRRDRLAALGGFDESYAYFLDETDVLLRLADAGGRIVFCERAEVLHKFAPGHLRSAPRVPRSLLATARSKACFVWRHAAPVYGRAAAQARLDAWAAVQAAELRALARQGLLTAADRKRLLEELAAGQAEGERLANEPPRLASFSSPPGFLPMRGASGRREDIVCPDYSHEGHFRGEEAVRGRLAALLADGVEAHVWRRAGTPCLDFMDGVWVHSLPDLEKNL